MFDEQARAAGEGEFPRGDWRDQSEPGRLPTMRDPEVPPRPARKFESRVE